MKKNISDEDMISISLSLNIPSYPKTNDEMSHFFKLIYDELIVFLEANLISFCKKDIIDIVDEAGNFVLIPVSKILTSKSSNEIKKICEEFEGKYSFGRILDVDVTDEKFNVISSNKLKKCYICEKSALECMRNKTHSIEELQDHISEMTKTFIEEKRKNQILKKITAIAIKSLLYEISLSPKPGLVDRFSSGSHKDMDYFTFINSTSALSPYLTSFAKLGYKHTGNLDNILPEIRVIGLQMEKDMFLETNGINTQKGIIFLLGLTIFAVTQIISNNEILSGNKVSEIIKEVTKNIVENELEKVALLKNVDDLTHGEICFKEFGDKLGGGVRYEVQNGLPTVIEHSLPFLKHSLIDNKKLIKETDLKEVMLRTFLTIMNHNNDSNIIYRKGIIIQNEIKNLANKALINNEKIENNTDYSYLIEYCKKENISPGGSADLLVVTLFLYFIRLEEE